MFVCLYDSCVSVWSGLYVKGLHGNILALTLGVCVCVCVRV